MQIQKKSFDGFAIANISPDAPEYSPTSYASYHQYNRFTREYLKTSAVYQSINIIGAECATVRVQLRNNKTQEVISYDKAGQNALLDLFYTPNKFETQQEFVIGVQGDLKLYGNAYILKSNTTTKGRPTLLFRLRPECLNVVLNDGGTDVLRYEYLLSDGRSKVYLPEQVIHIKDGYNPYSVFFGLPPIASVLIDNGIIRNAKDYNYAFFKNSAVPYGILVSDKPVNDNDEKKIKQSWYSSFSGAFRAFRMAVLGKGLVYQQIASSHSDIAFKDLLGMSEATIKGVYQIPPVMSGDYSESRYNTTEQRKIFYTQVIIPAMGKYVEALNNYLVPLYYPNSDYEFYADYSDKEFLYADANETAQAFATYNSTGVPKNDIIDLLNINLPKYEEWDTPSSPFDLVAGLNISRIDIKGITKNGGRGLTRQEAKAKAEDVRVASEPHQKTSQAEQKTHWRMQADQVSRVLKDRASVEGLTYDSFFNADNQAKLLFLAKKDSDTAMFRAALNVEAQYLSKLLKKSVPTRRKGTEERIDRWIKNRVFAWALDIEDTTAREINTLIQDAIAKGDGTTTLNARLREYFTSENPDIGKIAYHRLNTISQTEMLGVANEAAVEAYRSEDLIDRKEWITTDNDNHHEGHAEMDGQIVGKYENFINPITGDSAQAPQQFGIADQDINCLCTIAPIAKEK